MANWEAYEPYHPKIEEMLSNEMSIADVYRYIEQSFNVGMTFQVFWYYVKKKKLYLSMPGNVTMKRKPKSESKSKLPEGCKFPNCFECIFNDCIYTGIEDGPKGNELYEIATGRKV